jgi:hypothetical protein
LKLQKIRKEKHIYPFLDGSSASKGLNNRDLFKANEKSK